ncbi:MULTISPECIES: RDD family protein [unclassified Colwellia]|uniref:RDD family protein n=1 Tax=unclassified Colwellia TaxID=196834 RepID=UPI002174DE8A|nr:MULTISPECIES: RDD family protein [unclassified Colwellia]
MKCDVIYKGISNTKNIANLAGIIKRSFPNASKDDIVKYLKQNDLTLFSDVDEEKANKIQQAILKFGGKADIQFKNNNEDLFNIEEVEEDTTQETTNKNQESQTLKVDELLIAKPWKRSVVFFIDQLLITGCALLIGFLVTTFISASVENLEYLGFVLSLIYFTLMTANMSNGKTIGARLLKVKVVDENASPLNFTKSFIRSALFLVGFAFFLITAVSIFFNPKRRGFHDLISGAYVIEEEESSFASNAFTQKAQKVALEHLKRAQGIGMKKLQESVVQINSSMPYLENAGYTIAELEMELGVSPKVIVIVKMNNETTLTMDELKEKVKDKPIVTMLVNAIKMSADLQKKISIKSMRSVGMEISLAVTPSVKLLFAR